MQMQYADELALFCKNKKKPIMIAESTPFGGIKQGVGLGGNEAGTYVFLFSFICKFLRFFNYSISLVFRRQISYSNHSFNSVMMGKVLVMSQLFQSFAEVHIFLLLDRR